MTSLDDVAEFHMSGRRSVFTMKAGAKMDEAALEAAYDDNGLVFESVEQVQRAKAKTFYVANTGIT
jgi:hypothetical protein